MVSVRECHHDVMYCTIHEKWSSILWHEKSFTRGRWLALRGHRFLITVNKFKCSSPLLFFFLIFPNREGRVARTGSVKKDHVAVHVVAKVRAGMASRDLRISRTTRMIKVHLRSKKYQKKLVVTCIVPFIRRNLYSIRDSGLLTRTLVIYRYDMYHRPPSRPQIYVVMTLPWNSDPVPARGRPLLATCHALFQSCFVSLLLVSPALVHNQTNITPLRRWFPLLVHTRCQHLPGRTAIQKFEYRLFPPVDVRRGRFLCWATCHLPWILHRHLASFKSSWFPIVRFRSST